MSQVQPGHWHLIGHDSEVVSCTSYRPPYSEWLNFGGRVDEEQPVDTPREQCRWRDVGIQTCVRCNGMGVEPDSYRERDGKGFADPCTLCHGSGVLNRQGYGIPQQSAG